MRTYPFVTVDVFTDRRFGGNPLAVFPDARGLSDAEMQSLASELNLSETTFVFPPDDPAHTAKVRIFNRTHEMPFAGHPNVGTGYVLAGQRRDRDGILLFEELAGLVEVRVDRDLEGRLTGAVIAAPQPLSLGLELSSEEVASCAGLQASDFIAQTHPPIVASVGVSFVLAEVTGDALKRAAPQTACFRDVSDRRPALNGRLSLLLYAQDGDNLRARMFAPLAGTYEDPATGSANAALIALLLSTTERESLSKTVVQGVEMRRPSVLHVSARRTRDGIRSTVRGGCVPVFQGEALL
jgi:trans-2,3-dihydro-3-hydroxyanthranilate isomerase